MADEETGIESTIEITDADYPEIMRIVASDGEVDTYLESAGVAPDVFGDDADAGLGLCASERAALGGSLLYVVEVGEVTDASESDGAMVLRDLRCRLVAGVTDRGEQRGPAFGRLPGVDDIRMLQPDCGRRSNSLGLDGDRFRRAVEARPTRI